jgi:deoxyribodipyrimidine photo-lyase
MVQIAAAVDPVACHEVDAHNIVPCWVASDKREYGARTIRRKITDKLPEFLEVSHSLPQNPVITFPSRALSSFPYVP